MLVSVAPVAMSLPGVVGGVVSGWVLSVIEEGAEVLPLASLAFTEMVDEVEGESPVNV